jgi:exonuclease III
LWCRPPLTVPYRPRPRRSLLSIFVALLLLSGDVESNPGPAATGTDFITFGSFNIRSTRTKASLIQDIIRDNNIDILALQETWVPEDTHPAIKLDTAPPGFIINHVHRPLVVGGKKRGGGLAVIYREDLIVRPHKLHFRPTTFELQSLIVQTSPPILLVNIYQPNSPPTSEFYSELDTLLSRIVVESPARLVLCGDYNCAGDDGHSVNEHLDEVLVSCGLEQHVHQPTREGNLLDIVASSDSGLVRDVRVIDCSEVSDHCLITARLQSRRPPPPPPLQVTCRDLRRINLVDFEAALRRSALFTDPANTADSFAAQMQTVITEQLNKFAPLKTVCKRVQKASAKWLSAEAVAAKRERRRLERIWTRSRTESDRKAYRAACRRANALINSSRGDYIRKELDSCEDSRQRWTTVKKLLHSSDKKQPFDSVNVDLCDKFANFFVSKIAQLRDNISSRLSSQSTIHLPAEPSHSGPSLCTLTAVTSQEVRDLLSSIRPKSSALDYVPTSLLKTCSVFSEIIAKLANLSFQEGCFPQSFKTALVTPLIKKPNLDPAILGNFRPISNLNNISKILEKLFLSRLRPHVLESPNFNPLQSAYRSNHSTETALLCTLDNVFHSADTGSSTLLVSLDLSAAFDTIDHKILIDRLHKTFGVSGTALSWIISYLSNRTQLVTLGKLSSSPQACESGVPQGSVLGPLLFTLYVSPMASLLSQLGVSQHQYADDTQLHISISNLTVSADINTLESALSTLAFWFSKNWLALNPEKSDAILLGTYQRNSTLPVTSVNVAGSTVQLADNIKLLGVTLDKSLALRKHVSLVSQSCYYHIKALRYIRHTIDTPTASVIAHALISSRLDYANSLLYGSPDTTLIKLQRIQNTLARIVLQSSHHSHSHTLLQQLHWLPVHSRIRFKMATITYKALSTSSPQYLASILHQQQTTRYTTRSSDQQFLFRPRSRTNFGSRSFRCAAPSIWNAIPLHIRSAPSIDSFKRALKTHYFCHPPV